MLNLSMRSKNKNQNSCSFLKIKKEDFFPQKDLLERDSFTSKDLNNDEVSTDFFNYEKKLIQEYNILEGSNALYCNLDSDSVACLYEHEMYEDGDQLYSIYDKNGAFLMIESKGAIQRLFYTKEKDFYILDKKLRHTSRIPFLNQLYSSRSSNFIDTHSNMIVDEFCYNNTAENKALSDKFRQSFMKYKMSECLIPSRTYINKILSQVNKFVATGELDTDELLNSYMILCAFSEFCYSSIELIAPMIYSPNTVDFRELSEGLNKKLKNIDYLINLYFKDEIECAIYNQKLEKGDR